MKIPKLELKKKKKYRKGGFHTNPNVGWETLVFLTALVILLAGVYGTRLFLETSNEFEAPMLPSDAEKKTIARERIEKVLEYYSRKAHISAEIVTTPASLVDPSR